MLFELQPPPTSAAEIKTRQQMARLCKTQERLESAFGEIKQGRDYPYATGAEWSTHDLIIYLLEQIGPAQLTAATWSVAEHAAHKLIGLMDEGKLTSIEMLVDWRVQVRTPAFMPIARSKFSRIHVSSCHAKSFTLTNENWAISCVGSANFTNNPRIEAGHLSTSREAADFHRRWIIAEIEKAAPFGVDMRKIGKNDGRK